MPFLLQIQYREPPPTAFFLSTPSGTGRAGCCVGLPHRQARKDLWYVNGKAFPYHGMSMYHNKSWQLILESLGAQKNQKNLSKKCHSSQLFDNPFTMGSYSAHSLVQQSEDALLRLGLGRQLRTLPLGWRLVGCWRHSLHRRGWGHRSRSLGEQLKRSLGNEARTVRSHNPQHHFTGQWNIHFLTLHCHHRHQLLVQSDMSLLVFNVIFGVCNCVTM